MTVLIADKLAAKTVIDLEAMGAIVEVRPELGADDLPDAVGEADVLVVRSTKVTAKTIDAGPQLSLIVRAGAGVNTIDMAEASKRGIAVSNCPGKNTAAVAELAIGLLICADRRIPAATRDTIEGRWRKKEYQNAQGLNGRTLAVLGLGSIGRAVAVRAMGLGMQVRGWSRSLTPSRAHELGVEYCDSALDAVAGADAVTVHLAVSDDTRGFVGEELLGAMKEGSIFINTSRGEIVDENALVRAAREQGIRVALDVYSGEPAGGSAEFEPGAIHSLLAAATPHVGASTSEASEAIAAEVVRIVRSYKETGKPLNCVNIRTSPGESVSLVVRHYNAVGVLAGVLDELRNLDINVEEMENTIFNGAETATCTLKLDRAPADDVIERLQGGEHIIQLCLK